VSNPAARDRGGEEGVQAPIPDWWIGDFLRTAHLLTTTVASGPEDVTREEGGWIGWTRLSSVMCTACLLIGVDGINGCMMVLLLCCSDVHSLFYAFRWDNLWTETGSGKNERRGLE